MPIILGKYEGDPKSALYTTTRTTYTLPGGWGVLERYKNDGKKNNNNKTRENDTQRHGKSERETECYTVADTVCADERRARAYTAGR